MKSIFTRLFGKQDFINKYDLIHTFFVDEQDYNKFLNNTTKRVKSNDDGSCCATLTNNEMYYEYELFHIKSGKYIREFVKPFSPYKTELDLFNQGCLNLAKKLTIYIKTNNIKSIRNEEPSFGNLSLPASILDDPNYKPLPLCGNIISYCPPDSSDVKCNGELLFWSNDVADAIEKEIISYSDAEKKIYERILTWIKNRDYSLISPTEFPIQIPSFKYIAYDLVNTGLSKVYCKKCNEDVQNVYDYFIDNHDRFRSQLKCTNNHILLSTDEIKFFNVRRSGNYKYIPEILKQIIPLPAFTMLKTNSNIIVSKLIQDSMESPIDIGTFGFKSNSFAIIEYLKVLSNKRNFSSKIVSSEKQIINGKNIGKVVIENRKKDFTVFEETIYFDLTNDTLTNWAKSDILSKDELLDLLRKSILDLAKTNQLIFEYVKLLKNNCLFNDTQKTVEFFKTLISSNDYFLIYKLMRDHAVSLDEALNLISNDF